MGERKPLSKKTRFEVFKRDSFKCQYCGRSAPDVILEVDHIKPVAEGGTNSILNLVTSCRDCNRGKTKTLLSDDSAVVKQKKQADDIQARKEMIEMMAKWQEELLNEENVQINMIDEMMTHYFPQYRFSEYGRRFVLTQIKRFSFMEVKTAVEIALAQYDDYEEIINKIGGICYNRRRNGENNGKL